MVGTAPLPCEDEGGLFVLESGQLLKVLNLLLALQNLDQAVVEVDGPHGVVALPTRGNQIVAKGGCELHDPDPPMFEVHVWPPQPHQLSDPYARSKPEAPSRRRTVARHEHEEITSLLGGAVLGNGPPGYGTGDLG